MHAARNRLIAVWLDFEAVVNQLFGVVGAYLGEVGLALLFFLAREVGNGLAVDACTENRNDPMHAMFAAFQPHFVRIVAAGVPAPSLDAHHLTIGPGELAVQLHAHLFAQHLTGRVAVQNESVNQPTFLTGAEPPDAALVAVILRVDGTEQRHGAARHLRTIILATVAQLFPVDLFRLVFFPDFAQRRVYKGLELAQVLADLDPLGRNIHPGGERRINRPDMKRDRARRGDRLVIRTEPFHAVARPDAGALADVAPELGRLDHLVILEGATLAVLAQIPGALDFAQFVGAPLEPVRLVLAAPLQVLLTSAARWLDMESQVVRRFLGRPADLALPGDAQR